MEKKLIKSVGIITLIAIVSKILGFGRELLMAAYFGASTLTDAYFVASIIPVLLFTAVGMAITTGMVPLYAESKANGKSGGGGVVPVLGTLFLLISIILTVVFYFFTPFITKMMAPGFSEEQLDITNVLTMIMLPSFSFFVLSAISQGILEYEKRFIPPAFGAIPQNLLIIFTILFLSSQFGIYGIAVATLLGAVAQFLVQYPFIRKYQVLKLNFQFKKYKNEIIDSYRIFFPIIIASVAYQLTAVVDRMVASNLPEGSVSALNYSNKLMYLPLSIILLSLITVLFPSIVDAAVEKAENFIRLVFNGLKIIFFVGIPITVVMLVESQSLVDFAFKRGAFDDEASRMTTYAFFFYSFGMVFVALKEFLNRCFVALKQSNVTMIGSVAAVILNIILSIVLSKFIGIGGIALAFSIAMFSQTVFLFAFLPSKVDINKKQMLAFFGGFAKLVAIFLVVYLATDFIQTFYSDIHYFLRLVVTTIVTFALFVIVSILIRAQEISWLVSFLKSKKRSQKNVQ